MTDPTEADLEKARELAGHLSTLPQLAWQSTPCWGGGVLKAQTMASFVEARADPIWQFRVDAARGEEPKLIKHARSISPKYESQHSGERYCTGCGEPWPCEMALECRMGGEP